jgi:hypothetical protein
MNKNMLYITVSCLLLVYMMLEYTWIPWEDVPVFYNVPFVYDGGPVRLDSWIYNACVKVEHFLFVLTIHLVLDFKKETKWLLITFGLAFVEFFFTWNEPIAQIDLPFGMYLPISTTPMKFAAVAYFMYGTVKKIWE